MAENEVEVIVSANTKPFDKALDSVVKRIGTAASKIGSKMKGVGQSISLGITLPLVAAGAAALKFASDAEEVGGRFNAVFKGMEKETGKFFDQLANQVDRSGTELKGFAAGLGDIIKPLGFATEDAAELSKIMIQLGLDVAAFNNVSDAQAINAFASALTGEREALKSLGIVISEADVKQEAYTSGIAKAGKALTKQQKTLATVQLLFKNTADAQGSMTRESETFSNKLKGLTAAIKTTGEQIGKILIPPTLKLFKVFRNILTAVDKLTPQTKAFGLILLAVAAAAGPVLIILGALVSTIGALIPIVAAVTAFVGGLTFSLVGMSKAAMGALGSMGKLLITAAPLIIALAGMAAIAVIVVGAWDDIKFAATLLADGLLSVFKNIASFIKTTFVDPWLAIVTFMSDIFMSVVKGAVIFAKQLVKTMVRMTSAILNNSINVLISGINALIDALNTITFTNFSKIGEIKIDANKIIRNMGIAADGIEKKLTDAFEGAKKGAGSAFDEAAAFANDFADGVGKTGLQAGSDFADMFGKGIGDIGKIIKSKTNIDLSGLFSAVSGGGDGADTGAGLIPDIDTETITQKMAELAEKMKLINQEGALASLTPWQEWRDSMGNLTQDVAVAFINVFDSLVDGFANTVANVITEGENFADSLKNLFKDIAKQIVSALVKIGAQFLINAVLDSASKKAQGSSSAGLATANGIASMAAAPFPINLGAPAFGAAMGALAASAAATIGFSHGGIVTGPTNALIGEGGEPEAVIPLSQMKNMGMGGPTTINVNLDSRVLARAVVQEMPSVLNIDTGIST